MNRILPQPFFLQKILLCVFAVLLSACGYNKLQELDEQVSAAWSEVVNQYQRRAVLVPNLVETVKAYAKHEQDVLTQVTEARSKVGQLHMNMESLNDPASMAQFQQAQGEMTAALSRLIAVSENYPELKANTTFENLMTQLEGTENRITTARRRYIETVQTYNTQVRQFPSNLTAKMFGMGVKPNFTVENEASISTAPKVTF
ncbi:MAG: LemA family protein [Cardiobacteriaceae bacterium]|nr:LemA family protein [Cardiobacteriaceae bacterium]